MRVRMDEQRVAMPMRMRLRERGVVAVPMVLVVLMPMLVLHGFMGMFVVMPFGRMQIDAQRHQRSCDEQLRRDRLSQHENCESRADERGAREVGAGAGGAEVAQRQDEEDQAHPVAEKADGHGADHGR